MIESSAIAAITFAGFGSTTGLTVNGGAATATTTDGPVLRLTPANGNQAGSVFSTTKVSTAEFFSVFSFRITNPGGPIFDFNTKAGADGIVFVVQNQANNVGVAGQGIGFAGITPSLGVEYDTWGNASNNDPSQSHVGINLNGVVNHGSAGQGPTVNIGTTNGTSTAMPGPELDSGDRWWSWVVNDGTSVKVYLSRSDSTTEPPLPAAPILSHNVNLNSILGGSTAFAGFTSATGTDWANHDLLYWRYTEAVPEPSSAVLFVGTAAGLLSIRQRRRADSRIL